MIRVRSGVIRMEGVREWRKNCDELGSRGYSDLISTKELLSGIVWSEGEKRTGQSTFVVTSLNDSCRYDAGR